MRRKPKRTVITGTSTSPGRRAAIGGGLSPKSSGHFELCPPTLFLFDHPIFASSAVTATP